MKHRFISMVLLVFCQNLASGQANTNLSSLLNFDGEPYIAVNPANQDNIIAGWMRLRADGKIWIATKVSFDKGQTWSALSFMPHDVPENGSADVSIAFHSSGVAYIAWINFRQTPDVAGAVFVAKSTDGGLTWGAPNQVISHLDLPDNPFDRPWIAVDNSGGTNDGAIYVTTMTAYWMGGQHHIYLRTSTDGGVNWSTIKQVDNASFSVGVLTASYGGISIGKDGRAYLAFISYDVAASPFVRYYCVTTTDLGATFQRNVLVNASISGGSDFTKAWSIDANPTVSGNAALTWVDNRFGDYDIVLSKTTDGGVTWSAPVRVNDDPVDNDVEQDMVWADFSPSGNLSIAWRDRRLNGTGSTAPFDIYATISTDGAASIKPNHRVTSVSSPHFAVLQGNSFIGCAMSDTYVYLNWGDYRNSPDWDIYFDKAEVATWETVTEIPRSAPLSLKVFPNPAHRSITVTFSMPSEVSGSEIVIFNSRGQVQDRIAVAQTASGLYSHQVDITRYANGLFFLFLRGHGAYLGNATFVKN